MGKTLFITDLDGTLLNSRAKVSATTLNIINKLIDEGVIISYATARSFHTALPTVSEINFKYPAVHQNGIFINDPKSGEYLDKCIFEPDKTEKLVQALRENKIYPLLYSLIDGHERVSWIDGKETAGINFYLETRKNDKRLRPVQDYNAFIGDINQLTFVSSERDELEQIVRDLNLDSHFAYQIHIDAYKYTDGKKKYWLEIMRFDAQKDSAACKVKRLVDVDRIVCFGDNLNDICMFGASDESYAVANALPEVKTIATGIIGSNEHDGVARWLEQNAHKYL